MNLNEYCVECHKTATEKGFWDVNKELSTKLMLIVTEVVEACEADRKNNKEEFKEEIADVFIRLFDLCGYLNIDIEKEINGKMIINKSRPKLHGKRY